MYVDYDALQDGVIAFGKVGTLDKEGKTKFPHWEYPQNYSLKVTKVGGKTVSIYVKGAGTFDPSTVDEKGILRAGQVFFEILSFTPSTM